MLDHRVHGGRERAQPPYYCRRGRAVELAAASLVRKFANAKRRWR